MCKNTIILYKNLLLKDTVHTKIEHKNVTVFYYGNRNKFLKMHVK